MTYLDELNYILLKEEKQEYLEHIKKHLYIDIETLKRALEDNVYYCYIAKGKKWYVGTCFETKDILFDSLKGFYFNAKEKKLYFKDFNKTWGLNRSEIKAFNERAIIMPFTPEETCDLLNGNMKIVVRKTLPKDFIGWVYVYCTKGGQYLSYRADNKFVLHNLKDYGRYNGKVVAKFYVDEVEDIKYNWNDLLYETETLYQGALSGLSCLPYWKMSGYLGMKNGYAIYVDNLTIFDTPKELNEFKKKNESKNKHLPRYLPIKAINNYVNVEGE